MEFITSFGLLLQGLATTMTTPTFDSFVTMLTGWVFAPRRTVTRMILAAGDSRTRSEVRYVAAHHWGNRRRQGGARPPYSRALTSSRRALRRGQLRSASGNPTGKHALRP